MEKEINENQESIHGFYYYKLVHFLIKSTLPALENSFNIETLLKDYLNKELTNFHLMIINQIDFYRD